MDVNSQLNKPRILNLEDTIRRSIYSALNVRISTKKGSTMKNVLNVNQLRIIASALHHAKEGRPIYPVGGPQHRAFQKLEELGLMRFLGFRIDGEKRIAIFEPTEAAAKILFAPVEETVSPSVARPGVQKTVSGTRAAVGYEPSAKEETNKRRKTG